MYIRLSPTSYRTVQGFLPVVAAFKVVAFIAPVILPVETQFALAGTNFTNFIFN